MFGAPILLALVFAPGIHIATGSDGAFVVEARARYAVAGGPVSIDVTLKYRGVKSFDFDQYIYGGNVLIEPPASWVRRPRLPTNDDSRDGRFFMQTDWTRQETLHLHAQFAGIEPGLIRLPIAWRIARHLGAHGPNRTYHHLAQPKTELIVWIPPVSTERLTHVRDDLTARLKAINLDRLPQRINHTRGSDAGMTELNEIIETFWHTGNPAFIPLAMQLLALPAEVQSSRLIDFVYRTAPTSAAAHRLFVDQLHNPQPAVLFPFFNHWRGLQYAGEWRNRKLQEVTASGPLAFRCARAVVSPHPWLAVDRDVVTLLERHANLSDENLRYLEQAPDIWVRALTFAVLGDRVDSCSRDRLLADLERHAGPVDEFTLRDLLERLDAPRYAVRLAAQRELAQFGPIVEVRLRAELRKRPSSEVERRIEMILAEMPREKRDPRDVAALSYLQLMFDPRNVKDDAPVTRILQALAKPTDSSWIAQDAQLILAGKRP